MHQFSEIISIFNVSKGQQHSGICDSRGHHFKGHFFEGENRQHCKKKCKKKTGQETEGGCGGKSGTTFCRAEGLKKKHTDPTEERGQA